MALDYRLGLQASGTGAMAETLTSDGISRVVQISLGLSAAPTAADVFTVSRDAVAGSSYDTTVMSADMNGETELTTATSYLLSDGDALDFTLTNAAGSTWALDVWYENIT